jgi:lipopolysaccharide export system protein LptA
MPRPTSRRTVTGFRVALMLTLIAAVGVVVGLYLFGAAGAPRPRRGSGAAPPEFEEGTRMVGKDFDYTFSQGDKAVFRVRGNSIRVDKDDTVYLDQVGLTLYDKEGRRFDAESEEASINRTTNEGRLWGDVAIKGPSQLEIYSNQLLIQQKGNLLVTPGLARILYAGKYFARCDSLQAWLPDEIYSMLGKVRIETFPNVQPPLSLEAEKAIYERKRRQLRVEQNAELHRGTAKLDADRISGLLSEDESSLTFVRALYDVSGETAENAAPGTTKVSWEGNDLAVMLAPQGNVVRRVALEGAQAKPARLHAAGNAVTRNLVAPHIEGVLAANQILRSAQAFGGVDVEEIAPPAGEAGTAPAGARPAGVRANAAASPVLAAGAVGAKTGGVHPGSGGPGGRAPTAGKAGAPAGGAGTPQPTVRRAHGERGDATFRPDGQIANITLVEHVTYSDGEVSATGDRAAMDMDAGRGDFFGNPVDVVSPRGRMRAPHVIYTSADQLVHAVEGVHAVIEQANDANLAGTVLGEGKGPVMVQSTEAFWRRPQSSFLFRGDVRAWRGDNLLITPELRGERLPQGDELAATSGVKTVWIPSREEGAAPGRSRATAGGTARGAQSAGAAAAGGAGGARGGAAPASSGGSGPITVLASDMLYRDGSGLLTYSGNVHVDQEGKTLSCKQLDGTGETHLDDPANGRKIDGETGIYRLETRKIDILGDPVVMHDRDGNVVHGKRLRYAIDDGKVQVLGKDEGPAPPKPANAVPGSPAAAAVAVPSEAAAPGGRATPGSPATGGTG